MKPARKTQSTSCYHQYCKVGIQSNTWNVAVSFYFIYWNAIPSTKWLTILQLLFAVALASISRNKMRDSNSWRMICIKSWSCLWYLSSTFLLFFQTFEVKACAFPLCCLLMHRCKFVLGWRTLRSNIRKPTFLYTWTSWQLATSMNECELFQKPNFALCMQQ